MYKIVLNKYDIIIENVSEQVRKIFNYYELKELFNDYLKNSIPTVKGEKVNFSEVADHCFNYRYLGKDGNRLIFSIVN